ncbi:hypothetical protein LPB03_04245 [Polaribacter vadi]|uniref:Uncharacterized protein n=1 Tax=Polaribacter vadi TaxID=1774273 RepID=A0A1B8TXQ3_9FLAO|nr:hypothetical protein LPB03_04245 [Polaribacter vadi]OBY64370.1 hypothetical protein LPB3_08250 [Polaribacter vadi]
MVLVLALFSTVHDEHIFLIIRFLYRFQIRCLFILGSFAFAVDKFSISVFRIDFEFWYIYDS